MIYASFCQQLKQLAFTSSKSDSINTTTLFIAYSGGLDSTVLLHLSARFAQQHQLNITAIHINHGLSDNAYRWQQHCAQVCEELNVNFIAHSVEVKVAVKSGGQGLEGQARVARYDGLATVIQKVIDKVIDKESVQRLLLTGQHQQDQVETLFLQLKRGAGTKGLAAMAAKSVFREQQLNNTYLLRPLLACSREQLTLYAKQHQLCWIEDESNFDTRFDRNFLRHQVMPRLNQRWAQFDAMACRAVAHIGEQQQLIDEISQQDLAKLQHQDGSLCCNGLLGLTLLRRNNVLRYWFATNGVSMPTMALMARINEEVITARIDAQPQVTWQQTVLRRFKNRLYLTCHKVDYAGQDLLDCDMTRCQQAIALFDIQGERMGLLHVDVVDYLDVKTEQPIEKASLKTSQKHQLRAPNDDEQVDIRFVPKGQFNQIKCQRAGHQNSQKLGDLFKYYQVPPWLRQRTPLIYYDQQLVAVAGLFVCQAGVVDAQLGLKALAVKVAFDN